MATSPAANPYDQFDSAGGNPYDQFGGGQAPAQAAPSGSVGGPIARIGQALNLFPNPNSKADTAELIAGNPITRFAVGAASPAIAADQAFAKMVDNLGKKFGMYPGFVDALNQHLAEYRNLQQKGMEAYGGGSNVAGAAGDILNPVNLMTGEAVGPLGAGAAGVKKVLAGMGKGAAIGGAAGLSQPAEKVDSDYWVNKIKQGGVGALYGAILSPLVDVTMAGAKSLYHLIEPILPGGQESILKRTVGKVVGDKADEVAAALDAYKAPLAGEPATASQAATAANSAELAGLQKIVTPMEASRYQAISDAQNAARRGAIGTVGEGQAAIKAAQEARTAVAQPLYKAAETKMVPNDETLQSLLQRPTMTAAIKRANTLSQDMGLSAFTAEDPSISVGNLHSVKMALDDLTSNPERFGIGASEVRTVGEIRKQLLHYLDTHVSDYGKARTLFAQMSQPVNQAEVLTDLSKKLNPALTNFGAEPAQRAATFANAVQEAPQTIKRATGQARFNDLGQILSPEQMSTVQSVGESLGRNAREAQLANAGAANAARLLRMSFDASKPEAPHVLEHKFVIWNYIINRLAGTSNERTLELLSQRMADPAEFRKLLNAMPAGQRNRVYLEGLKLLNTQGITPQQLKGIATGAGGNIGGAMSASGGGGF